MKPPLTIEFISQLEQLSAPQWNALCKTDYPFLRYEFLCNLEKSKSVGEKTGWLPQHLIIKEGDALIAAVPLYLKSHSYGEYVFDWAWADAYQRYGYEYYPKLITVIPFTPCMGSRFLLEDETRAAELIPIIVSAIKSRATLLKVSGWHCLFPTQEMSQRITSEKTLQRLGCQFHWHNQDYKNWDDFVNAMTSRKRKSINKERRHVQEQDIHFIVKEGDELTSEDYALFYQFYCSTYVKRSGHTGYLTESFFHLLHENFNDYVVMIIAHHHSKPIAASLFFKDSNTLYGRYWGCLEEFDFLHFETCYYQGIEYAIKHHLQRFDGGAQGEHKIQRGFTPVLTYSNHWLVADQFQHAITDFLLREAESIMAYQQDAQTYLPFKASHE